MDRLYDWLTWARENSDLFIDMVRIYIGIGLFIRGILFLSDATFLSDWLAQFGIIGSAASALRYYVTFAHIAGGALLAIGYFTRISSLIQIPILAGAVFFIHFPDRIVGSDQSFEFSALVLFLLILFLIRGSGRLSLRGYLAQKKASPTTE